MGNSEAKKRANRAWWRRNRHRYTKRWVYPRDSRVGEVVRLRCPCCGRLTAQSHAIPAFFHRWHMPDEYVQRFITGTNRWGPAERGLMDPPILLKLAHRLRSIADRLETMARGLDSLVVQDRVASVFLNGPMPSMMHLETNRPVRSTLVGGPQNV